MYGNIFDVLYVSTILKILIFVYLNFISCVLTYESQQFVFSLLYMGIKGTETVVLFRILYRDGKIKIVCWYISWSTWDMEMKVYPGFGGNLGNIFLKLNKHTSQYFYQSLHFVHKTNLYLKCLNK